MSPGLDTGSFLGNARSDQLDEEPPKPPMKVGSTRKRKADEADALRDLPEYTSLESDSRPDDSQMAEMEVVDRLVSLWTTVKL